MTEKKDRFFIPNKIKVGYQERSDTFTGKLSYIIYYDELGKLRKERSWNSWRDSSIPDNEFDNIPIEGFYLNKAVGGYKSSWNYRMTYCRIYDPRGFEFEIGVDNLLWILDHSECLKGKKLTGKFVYSWVGTELVLLPCDSEEYDESKVASDKTIDSGSIKLSDLVPGALYKVKYLPFYIRNARSEGESNDSCIFLGNFKLSKFLNEGYETKPIFYDKNTDLAFTMTKSNIKFMIESDFLNKSEIKDLTHRFNISAYSQEFWKSNIVKEFIDVAAIKFPKLIRNDTNIFSNSYIFSKDIYSGGIDDSGNIFMLRPIVTSYNSGRGGYYVSYQYFRTDYYKNCKFILGKLELLSDNTINVSILNDIGKPTITYAWGSSTVKNFTDIYPNTKIATQPSTSIPENINKIVLGYKTIDGYVSNSLHFMLNNDCIYGLHRLEYFPLPIKI